MAVSPAAYNTTCRRCDKVDNDIRIPPFAGTLPLQSATPVEKTDVNALQQIAASDNNKLPTA
jgi:hypothetical protein